MPYLKYLRMCCVMSHIPPLPSLPVLWPRILSGGYVQNAVRRSGQRQWPMLSGSVAQRLRASAHITAADGHGTGQLSQVPELQEGLACTNQGALGIEVRQCRLCPHVASLALTHFIQGLLPTDIPNLDGSRAGLDDQSQSLAWHRRILEPSCPS